MQRIKGGWWHGLALVCGLVGFSASLQAQDLENGLIARYAFDGDMSDDGPSGYTGRTIGAPVYTRGLLGQALRFDGSDDVAQFTGIPATTFNGSFSASWFMQVDDLERYSLLSKRDACAGGNHFDVQLGDDAPDQIGFNLSRAGQIGTTTARATANDGPWIHVAVVRDATSARVYVDGRSGAAVSVGTTNFAMVASPLEFGGSPCIGAIGGPRRYRGLIDELRVYDRALSSGEVSSLARVTSLSVAPASASVGTRISMRMNNLEIGRTYELRLRQGRTLNQLLATVSNATASATASATLPAVARGAYEIALIQRQPLQLTGGTLVRSTPFTVAPGLTLSNITAQPQAGKRALVTVGNLAEGALQLKYGSRIVYGPTPVSGTTSVVRFRLPADFPSVFPANVVLRAELLSGRSVVRAGSETIRVTAPFTGQFSVASGLTSSLAQARPRDQVRISGQLTLADGATIANTQVSAFWVANSGQISPLPTQALTFAQDGSFTLDTQSPSFLSMSALVPAGPGRLRLVSSRLDLETGLRQAQLTEGPQMASIYDDDPQAEITMIVRARGGSNTVPLRGAYIVVDRDAPLQTLNIVQPPETTDSPYAVPGVALFGGIQPLLNFSSSPSLAVNQLPETLSLPPPPCGTSIFRRYTDATGRAEFEIGGVFGNAPANWGAAQSSTSSGTYCVGGSCTSVMPNPAYEFTIRVFTVHLGAGVQNPDPNAANSEIPSAFRVRYDGALRTFRITDLRTGVTTTQQNSANIIVEVTPFTQIGNGFVTLSDPVVMQGLDVFRNVPSTGGGGFGKWVDFEGLGGTFARDAPTRRIRFKHQPDAGGSIVSAKLFLPNISTGTPNEVGTFSRTTTPIECSIQDDGSMAGTEEWQLDIVGTLAESWRLPRGVFFSNNATERKACGFIRATNELGGTGRRNICFLWQALPDSARGGTGRLAYDENPLGIYIERNQIFNEKETVLTLPPTIDGEPIEEPRRRDNQTRTARVSVDVIGPTGPNLSSRDLSGANPRQFANPASGRSASNALGNGVNEITLGSDALQTIVDETIPLFKWVWGVPELFGAEVYADLRLLADYYFYGTLRRTDNGERLDMITNPRFGLMIDAGFDIDVLFGLLFDAGAFLTGGALSSMPTVIENNSVTRSGPCFQFVMTFTGYYDPFPLLPTPVVREVYPIIDEDAPNGCAIYVEPGNSASVSGLSKAMIGKTGPTPIELRQLRRHPALAFDDDGNGQMAMLDASQALVMAPIEGGVPQSARTLSSGVNPRQPQIVYYAPDRAVAVWAESALTVAQAQGADINTLSRNQRIMASQFNGAGWSRKVALTPPSGGEGFPQLAACHAGAPDCPAGGEVTAVWQRNDGSDYRSPTHRLKFARYLPASGWSAIGDVAPGAGSSQDITPSVTYLGASPLVVWVRTDTGALGDFNRRRLAYRHIGIGGVLVASNVTTGLIAPNVRATSPSDVVVAFTRADDNTGAIGTRQALHTAFGNCRNGSCSWTWRRAADRFNRAIYGERPQVVVNAAGEPTVVMRAFQFRGDDGEPVQLGDPIGTVISSGDLLAVQVARGLGRSRTVAISADGATHFGVAAAFNPMTAEIATLATTYVPANLVGLQAAVKAAGYETQVAYGKAVASVGGVEMRALPVAPDLGVEQLTSNVQTLAPNAPAQATVRIGNRGAGYDAAADGVARLELRWDLPTGTGAPLASANIASLGAGEERDVVLSFNLPANAYADEPHALYAVIVPAESSIELSGDNNIGRLEFAGLPVPTELASSTRPGMAPVQLGWTTPDDPRIAGYRVYRRDGANWVPLGSSPRRGFLDLSAQFGIQRSYAVTSYSARGVESERSEMTTTMPVLADAPDDVLLNDGFEGPAP